MWRPTSDIMIIEKYEELNRISMPDNIKTDTGDTFIVKDVGPGFIDNGIRIEPEIKIGDRVAIMGKLLRVPTQSNNGVRTEIILARAGDVICYERNPELPIEENSNVAISADQGQTTVIEQ